MFQLVLISFCNVSIKIILVRMDFSWDILLFKFRNTESILNQMKHLKQIRKKKHFYSSVKKGHIMKKLHFFIFIRR